MFVGSCVYFGASVLVFMRACDECELGGSSVCLRVCVFAVVCYQCDKWVSSHVDVRVRVCLYACLSVGMCVDACVCRFEIQVPESTKDGGKPSRAHLGWWHAATETQSPPWVVALAAEICRRRRPLG